MSEYWLNRYRENLDALPSGKGQRNAVILPKTAWSGVKAGIDENQIISDIMAATSSDPLSPSDIRHAIRTAAVKIGSQVSTRSFYGTPCPSPWKKPKPQSRCPDFVKTLVEKGKGATFDTLKELSPTPVKGLDPTSQTDMMLVSLWDPGDMLFVFTEREAGTPGVNLMTCEKWRSRLGSMPGDKVAANPLTGKVGKTTDGRPSYIAQDCIASYRYIIIEYDDMPISDQCAFWSAYLRLGRLKPAALVFSGSKSIHGLMRLDATDLSHWNRLRDRLVELFAGDPTEVKTTNPSTGLTEVRHPMRADIQCMRPRQGIRLAGVTRATTGKVQELLYLDLPEVPF